MSDRDARYSLDDPDHPQDTEFDDPGDDPGAEDYPPVGGRRKRRGRSIPGCLAALVALALIAGGAYVAVTKGAEFIRDQFSTAAGLPRPRHRARSSSRSSRATPSARSAATSRPRASCSPSTPSSRRPTASSNIQVGYYQLKKEMTRRRRLRHPQQPGQHHQEHRDHPRGPAGRRRSSPSSPRRPTTRVKAFEKALADPAKIGLPDYANGNAGGLPLPVDLRLRAQGQARRHAHEDGRPLAAGRRRRGPGGQGGRDGLHARPRS